MGLNNYYEYMHSDENDTFTEYTRYFQSLFEDVSGFTLIGNKIDNLNPYRIDPRILAGSKMIRRILENSCKTMTLVLKKCKDFKGTTTDFEYEIFAYVSVIDWPDSTQGVQCRYNTNVVSSYGPDEISNLSKFNKDPKDLRIKERHVVGEVVRHQRIVFRTTTNNNEQPSFDDSQFTPCISLAIPICVKRNFENVNEYSKLRILALKDKGERKDSIEEADEVEVDIFSNVLAVIGFEFHNNLSELFFEKKDDVKDNTEQLIEDKNGFNGILKQVAIQCKDDIVTYLGLNEIVASP